MNTRCLPPAVPASRPVRIRASRRLPVFRSRRALAVCFCIAINFGLLSAVWAQQFGRVNQQQNGAEVQMPTNYPVSPKNGLSLTIDTRWVNNYGYRPIEVTVKSLTPTTADHRITIRIQTSWWGMQRGSMTVEQEFDMLQGSTTATTLVALPQYQLTTQYYWWDVWVDGIKDKDLSRDRRAPVAIVGSGVTPNSATALSVLVVGPNARQPWSTNPNSQDVEAMSLPVRLFPARWIDYTCFDVVSLSRAELQAVAQSNPSALAAIRHWISAGGQLWIGDAGASWEHLPEVSKTLSIAATIDESDEAPATKPDADANEEAVDEPVNNNPIPAAWRPVPLRRGGTWGRSVTFLNLSTQQRTVVRDQDTIRQFLNDPNHEVVAGEAPPEMVGGRSGRWPRDSRDEFVDQSLGLGAIRAFRGGQSSILFPAGQPNVIVDPNIAPEGNVGKATAREMALRATRRWDFRHGMKPDDANLDFANWLVPDVGLAPVIEFQVLITLFVLLIGPLNYWLLKRYNRLQLLVLTVPLAALLLTGTLFAYAVLSDGFGTTVRAQSVTTLNQHTGDAASWSRLSYYSGLAPGQGLSMPGDVVVYPIIPAWNDSGVDPSIGASRELFWVGDEARMTRGWLRSRTPTQYLSIRARKSPYRLELMPAAGKIRAVNELGTTIRFVLVVDKEGKLFSGTNMAPGSKWVLEPIERAEAIRQLRNLFRDHAPEAPPELSAKDSDYQRLQRRQARRMMVTPYRLQYSEQRLDDNLLGEVLADLSGMSGQPALRLPPQSYVAITETGPEVALGIPDAKEEASFHVVIGHW